MLVRAEADEEDSSAEIGLTTGLEVKRVACSDLEASNCPVALALLNPAKPAILPIGDEVCLGRQR